MVHQIVSEQIKVAADKAHVLLVEDNSVALHIIETLAAQAGLKFTSAIDGESALMLARSYTFDLIITDLGLPGISGYELTSIIRQLEKDLHQQPVPIVGLTAHALHEVKKECLQSGMNNILCKPINLKTIEALIHQFILEKVPQETILSSLDLNVMDDTR